MKTLTCQSLLSSTQQRLDLLLAALQKDSGLDRLKKWPLDLARKVVALLLEFHHVFSLEPNEIGCTDTMEHVIELMKDKSFKERFQCIAPPLMDEMRQHMHTDVGWWHHPTLPVAMVQCHGAGEEEG